MAVQHKTLSGPPPIRARTAASLIPRSPHSSSRASPAKDSATIALSANAEKTSEKKSGRLCHAAIIALTRGVICRRPSQKLRNHSF